MKDRSRARLGLPVLVLTVALALVWSCWAGGRGDAGSPADEDGSTGSPAAEAPLCTQPGYSVANHDRHLDAPYVILISFDGFRWDYLDRFETPAFDRVAATGTRAERFIPVFPTKTFPTHYSIATGMYAENHGLVGNRFWAPEKEATYSLGNREAVEDGSWYGGEPIWVTAERQGMVSASFFFVGSEADVGGVRPTYCHRFDGRVPNEERVDGVLGWLGLPPRVRPHMITLYFSDVDGAGHDFGPYSEEVEEAVRVVDEALGRLLDGLAELPHGEEVNVIAVSDHGMLLAAEEDNDFIDLSLFPGVRMVEGGPYASFFVDVDDDGDRAARVRDSLQAMMPLNQVFLRTDVPARFHYSANPRIGDIVAIAAPGRQIQSSERAGRLSDFYNHGWDNMIPEMAGILLAAGPQIAERVETGPVEAVHVYPLIAEILGLEPHSEIDGNLDAIAQFLRR